ncbi:MAG: biopolymer transport protein ExbB [Alteromonadaceae bacterium]|jgi:biopolymer transport protein ExbB
MKKLIKSLAVIATFALSASSFTLQAADGKLDQLLEQVKKDRISDGKINKQREAEFTAGRADKQALLTKAEKDLKAEKARGERLSKQFSQNETTLTKKAIELDNAKGDLGEIFGVVRRQANETIGTITGSIISAQFPGREDVLFKLAEAKELPTIRELEELWIALQTEMTESGKVAKFETEIVSLDGETSVQQLTRVGTFNLMGPNQYLIYNIDTLQVQPLGRPAEGHFLASVSSFNKASSGSYVPLYIDPSKGSLLRLNTQKATLQDRYEAGGLVGYIITGVLVLGMSIFLFRVLGLTLMQIQMRGQLKNTANPGNNPLGRILKVYHANKEADVENLELKLDEAILRELPSIDRGITVIKILAAIAPLLGLLGTVVGMINTFQQITLFGTGDPKIMAGSISMALVTTAQGLIAALPLIFVHSLVAGQAKSVTNILDLQSAGIIAAHSEKENA